MERKGEGRGIFVFMHCSIFDSIFIHLYCVFVAL